MAIDTSDILATLREQFLSDPDDQMDQIEILALGFIENSSGALKDIMRVAHNLKGSSQLCGLPEFSHFVHQCETVFQSLSLHVYSDDDLANAAALIRRLGTLLRKKFEAIRDKLEVVNSRELAAWDATIKGLTLIADSSPLVSVDPNQTAVEVPTSSSADDWGFGNAAEATSSELNSPMESTPMESNALETKTPESEAVAAPANQGWGVFEDTPAAPALVTAEHATEPQGWGIFEDSPVTAVAQASVRAAVVVAPAAPPPDVNAVVPLRPTATASIVKSTPKSVTSYLLCHHNERTYAVPVDQVQEILPDKKLKALPISRKNVAGVISFRGQIMPVIDMFTGKLLSAFSNDVAPSIAVEKAASVALRDLSTISHGAGCIVVCQIDRRLFGVRVERVSSVIDIKDNLLQPIQMKGASEERRIVTHLAIVNNETISFIDLLGVLPT
jgi:chemotaxis signal transduction protein/HPt (histidine-containing phosphotransfer) domain-containing protein